MKKFFKVVVARWLARTPFGLAVLGVGWLLGRRKQRAQVEQGRGARRAHGSRKARPVVRSGRRR
ncbi:DUF6203 family protein [Streptosporangium sp. NPDC023615]|uniref:DUF6203 family protein n=1 Tax=Streptosporangium sp. NPDC023615 TaxID=3154794 RepID=UPI0034134C0C